MMGCTIKTTNVTIDDHVDDEIAQYLDLQEPRSFFMYAGAGSGKTRSLVNALKHIQKEYSSRLRLRGQQVGVITYTNAACDEITRRIDFDPLFHISTIHSFAWNLIGSYNADIREWLRRKLAQDILDLKDKEKKGRPGTKASVTRQAQIESKGRRIISLNEIKLFIYNPTGENKEKNSLNHSEVIEICAGFLADKPLMQRILVNQYPFLLIDESQDTNKHLIDAFLQVELAHHGRFMLGLFGDTMQRIYGDGKENIERELPDSWGKPEKKLNHRCPRRIVKLINKVRSEVDCHIQEPRSDSIEGCVRLFIFPIDTNDRSMIETDVRGYMAIVSKDDEWINRDKCKILTLEHHMAAKRMGFENIFRPLYAVEDFRTGLLDGKLPALRFFTQNVLPLVIAQKRRDKFTVAKLVREFSPLLSRARLKASANQSQQLMIAQEAIESLMSLWDKAAPSCGAVLKSIAESELFLIPDSLIPLLQLREMPSPNCDPDADQSDPVSDEIDALAKFLEAPFSELESYSKYVADEAPFDTHQGVKGLEFDRVMVIMDDSEARGFMFGFEKFLGAKERSPTDINNEQEGKDSTLDRTRRLFYVTCSRAKTSLALVAYSADPTAINKIVIEKGWFTQEEIIDRDLLNRHFTT